MSLHYKNLFSPFEQFEIQFYNLFDTSYIFTDTIIITLFLLLFFQVVYLYTQLNVFNVYFISYVYSLFEYCYTFIYSMLESYLGDKTKYYFPFFFYLFLFIAFSNLVGITPYSFTITSHLNITFSLSFMVWWGIVLLGLYAYGLEFFELFFAHGVPFRLVPFLVLIELISFLFRAVSLALRLFANLVAGHILLDTVSVFIYDLINPFLASFNSVILSLLPFMLCVVLVCFEFVVAILQAYIFVILSVIYLKDIYAFH